MCLFQWFDFSIPDAEATFLWNIKVENLNNNKKSVMDVISSTLVLLSDLCTVLREGN